VPSCIIFLQVTVVTVYLLVWVTSGDHSLFVQLFVFVLVVVVMRLVYTFMYSDTSANE